MCNSKAVLGLLAAISFTVEARVSIDRPVMVKDINRIQSSDTHAVPLFGANGLLLFTAFTPGTGWELWRSDGTTAGTGLVKDMTPGQASSFNRDAFRESVQTVLLNGSILFTDSVPRLGPVLPLADGNIRLEWPSVVEHSNLLLRSARLPSHTDDDIVVERGIQATTPINRYIDRTASGPGPYFYRLQLE